MLVDERTRRLMGEALIRAHGEEAADAIMAHLPPQGYGELATRQDVREAAGSLRVEMHDGFSRMSERFAAVEERISGVHGEIGRQIGHVHDRVSGVEARITGVHQEISRQGSHIHDRISGVEERITGVHQEISRQGSHIHDRISGVEARITGVHEEIAGVHRAIARGTIALLVGLLGSPVVGIVAERLLSP